MSIFPFFNLLKRNRMDYHKKLYNDGNQKYDRIDIFHA